MNRFDVRKQRESFQIPTQRKPRCVGHQPENLRSAMKLHCVETMDQVLAIALERPLPEIVQEIAAETTNLTPMVPPAADEGPATHQ